jgi:anti-sigma factor RsiW
MRTRAVLIRNATLIPAIAARGEPVRLIEHRYNPKGRRTHHTRKNGSSSSVSVSVSSRDLMRSSL